MNSRKKVILTLGVAVLIIAGLWFIANSITRYTGYSVIENSDEFAKCLADNSVLYSREGCSHCANQKAMFGESLKYLNIVECSENLDLCISKNLDGVPAWEIKGQIYYGVQDLEMLSELTGCSIQ